MFNPGTKVKIVQVGFNPEIIGIVVKDDGKTVIVNRDIMGFLPEELKFIEVPSNQVVIV